MPNLRTKVFFNLQKATSRIVASSWNHSHLGKTTDGASPMLLLPCLVKKWLQLGCQNAIEEEMDGNLKVLANF